MSSTDQALLAEMTLAVIRKHKRDTSDAVRSLKNRMGLREGSMLERLVTVYVRDPEARRQCIEKYGARCFICNFSFAEKRAESNWRTSLGTRSSRSMTAATCMTLFSVMTVVESGGTVRWINVTRSLGSTRVTAIQFSSRVLHLCLERETVLIEVWLSAAVSVLASLSPSRALFHPHRRLKACVSRPHT